MSMSVETWVIVIVLLLAVAGATYYVVDKNREDFKKKEQIKHKKLVAERMAIANKRKQQKAIAQKELNNTINVATGKLSPAASRLREQMRIKASNFQKKLLHDREKQRAVENFRKEKMMHSPPEKEYTSLSEIQDSQTSEIQDSQTSGNFVFTNDHIAPTYGGVKKFTGHGHSDGDHIRGDIEVKGRGVFPGQSPQHSTLETKKGFMHL